MSDGMGREPAYLSSHATNRYFIPNWGNKYLSHIFIIVEVGFLPLPKLINVVFFLLFLFLLRKFNPLIEFEKTNLLSHSDSSVSRYDDSTFKFTVNIQ